MNWKTETDEITRRKELALEQGGPEAIAKHHGKGRLTIRERIDKLLDPDSFEEVGPAAGAANLDENGELESFDPANFVLGFGKVDGFNFGSFVVAVNGAIVVLFIYRKIKS